MPDRYCFEACVFCENINTNGKEIFEKEMGVCPQCGRNEWVFNEADESELVNEKTNNTEVSFQ